jgi:hypothetical protein
MDLGMQARAAAAGHSVSNLTRLDLRTAAWAAPVVHSDDLLTGVDLGMEVVRFLDTATQEWSGVGFPLLWFSSHGHFFSFVRLWSSTGAHQAITRDQTRSPEYFSLPLVFDLAHGLLTRKNNRSINLGFGKSPIRMQAAGLNIPPGTY